MSSNSKYIEEYDRLRGNKYLQRMSDIDYNIEKCPEQEWPLELFEKLKFDDLVIIHDKIRAEVKREDDLVNQRNTWCILFSTALSAGFMALASKAIDLNAPELFLGSGLLFSFVGIYQSWKCAEAVNAAKDQIEYLFCIYLANRTAFLKHGLFRPFGRQDTHNAGIGYSKSVPLINLVYWMLMFVGSLFAFVEVGLWSKPSFVQISL